MSVAVIIKFRQSCSRKFMSGRWESYRMQRKHHYSIRTWLITMLMIFALVPTLALGVLVTQNINQKEKNNGIERIDKATRRMADDIELIMQDAENMADILALNEALHTASDLLLNGTTKSREIELYLEIIDVVSMMNTINSSFKIRIFLPEGNVVTHEQYTIFPLKELESIDSDFFADGVFFKTGWSEPHDIHIPGRLEESPVVTYYRAGAEESLSKNLIVAIDVEQSLFSYIMNETDGMDGTFRLYNSSGNIVASAISGTDEGKNIYNVSEPIGDWTFEAEIPLSQFTGVTISSQIMIVLVLLGCIFIILVLANLSSRHTVRELKLLEDSSERAMEGIYEPVDVGSAIHEIRTLQLAHNAMMDNIDELIHDIYMARIKHISILFEQIKPHFLYNTLERAKWLARKNKDDEIMIFLEKFAQFLHLFLSEGKDQIPIRQELKHIGLYVDLMTFGTDQEIVLDIKVPEEIMDEQIIKLILQPLVENSVIHGLLEKDTASGTITISACSAGDDLEITISDDGVGIEEEQLTILNSERYAGYGTRNTKKRLELCYEENYSMVFANNEAGGASVRIRIPKGNK